MALFTGNVLLDLTAVIIALLLVVYVHFQWTYQIWKRKKIPYLEPKFPYGNLPLGVFIKQTSLHESVFQMVKKAKKQGK